MKKYRREVFHSIARTYLCESFWSSFILIIAKEVLTHIISVWNIKLLVRLHKVSFISAPLNKTSVLEEHALETHFQLTVAKDFLFYRIAFEKMVGPITFNRYVIFVVVVVCGDTMKLTRPKTMPIPFLDYKDRRLDFSETYSSSTNISSSSVGDLNGCWQSIFWHSV